MELIFEFILDLVFEGIEEIGTDRRIKAWIRIPLLGIIILLYLSVVTVLFICGIIVLKTNVLAAVIILAVTGLMIWGTIGKLRSIYHKIKRNNP